jgi:hypothetical protein
MARRKEAPKTPKARRRSSRSTAASAPRARRAGGFVGRDGSPVLDRYPRADAARAPLAAPTPLPPTAPLPNPTPPGGVRAPAAAPAAPPKGLLSLERPFDVDGFSQLLGETSIRVEVPKEALAEVLRRVTDFMGFGIYVYRLTVRPAPDEMLRRFVVELQRVDYSAAAREWVPFEEQGPSDSPFGPGGSR